MKIVNIEFKWFFLVCSLDSQYFPLYESRILRLLVFARHNQKSLLHSAGVFCEDQISSTAPSSPASFRSGKVSSPCFRHWMSTGESKSSGTLGIWTDGLCDSVKQPPKTIFVTVIFYLARKCDPWQQESTVLLRCCPLKSVRFNFECTPVLTRKTEGNSVRVRCI